MCYKKIVSIVVASVFILSQSIGFASAQRLGGPYTFDEQGNSSFGAGFLAADTGPGGLASVLTYNLPFTVIPGDVFLSESGVFLDLIRFNTSPDGKSTLVFYSDNLDGLDALGDTQSPPSAFYTNTATIPEIGPEGNNGALYFPAFGAPGSTSAAVGIQRQYIFISDGTFSVPEPTPLVLVGLGLLAMMSQRKRKP